MLKIQDGVSIVEKLNGQLVLNTKFWFGNKERDFRKEIIKIRKTAKFGCEML